MFIFLHKKLGFPNKQGDVMTEYRFEKCVVRIHGSYDQDNLRSATEKFVKKVVQNEKKKKTA
jgi:hypothetical protein